MDRPASLDSHEVALPQLSSSQILQPQVPQLPEVPDTPSPQTAELLMCGLTENDTALVEHEGQSDVWQHSSPFPPDSGSKQAPASNHARQTPPHVASSLGITHSSRPTFKKGSQDRSSFLDALDQDLDAERIALKQQYLQLRRYVQGLQSDLNVAAQNGLDGTNANLGSTVEGREDAFFLSDTRTQ